MIYNILIFSSILCLVIAVYIWFLTMKRCKSEKKYFFIFSVSSLIFFIMGHILELLSQNADGALAGVKIMYVGACLITPFFLLFVIDYCDIDIPKKYITPIILTVPLISLVFVWTTDYHLLFYKSWFHDRSVPHMGLQITPGIIYDVIQIYTFLYMILACIILANRMIKWNKIYRQTLFLFILAATTPLLAQGLYLILTFVFKSHLGGISYTPYALVISNVLVCINIIKYDSFDIAPKTYSMSFDLLWETVILIDADMKYNSSNRSAINIFPDIVSLRKGMPVTMLKNWPAELANINTEKEHEDINFKLSDENEKYYTAHIGTYSVTSGKRTLKRKILGYTLLIRDITETTLLMNQLRTVAYTDALTGLYNRRHFYELSIVQMDRAARENSPCCVMMIDIDFFKKCNDTYGHQAGDEVLRLFAIEIRKTIRSYDILGRYGGEEFSIFAPNTNIESAFQLAERIRKQIERTPCVYKDIIIKITCSIGIAARTEGKTLEELLDCADKALYSAKQNGRNRCEAFRQI